MPITGCAYYPEHWNQERWAGDAATMREVGLQVVRLAEFAWDKMEPEEGEYNFAWLDSAVETLAAAGLQIVMCTPTPTPPPWLTHQHPDILRVERNGVRVSPGARRHATANAPAYLEHSRRIVEAITARYGKHPAVIGWQVDNEFGCGETTRSYGEHDHTAFIRWLEEQYGSLDALNAAWGTQFWGMSYRDWAHIPIPGITTEPQSPSMRLDFNRFSSDAWVRFQRMQIEIIRRNSPERWITHNFMIRHWSLDYWRLAEDLDFISYDNYPHGLRNPAETALNLDLMWSLKRQSFWVMEQQPGQVNWHAYNPPVPPGQVRLWSHQAVAHGANAVVYFRFRACLWGTEQRHGGLLKHDATPDQCYYEAQAVSREFATLPDLQRPHADTAIFFDYDDLWAIEMEPHQQQFSYWELVYDLYRHFWKRDQRVDFLRRGGDLSAYRQLILPAGVLTHPGEADALREWVSQGGRLIIVARTGYRTPVNTSVAEARPAGMTDLIGGEMLQYYSQPPKQYKDWKGHRAAKAVQFGDGNSVALKIWAEELQATSAEVLATYQGGILDAKPAILRNRIGAGEVIYVGCWLKNWRHILGDAPAVALHTHSLVDATGKPWQLTLNHALEALDGIEGLGAQYQPAEA